MKPKIPGWFMGAVIVGLTLTYSCKDEWRKSGAAHDSMQQAIGVEQSRDADLSTVISDPGEVAESLSPEPKNDYFATAHLKPTSGNHGWGQVFFGKSPSQPEKLTAMVHINGMVDSGQLILDFIDADCFQPNPKSGTVFRRTFATVYPDAQGKVEAELRTFDSSLFQSYSKSSHRPFFVALRPEEGGAQLSACGNVEIRGPGQHLAE